MPHFLANRFMRNFVKSQFLSQRSQWNVTRVSSCDQGSFLNENVEVPQEIGCHLMSVVAAFVGSFLAIPTQVIVAWPYENREWLKYWVVQASKQNKCSFLWSIPNVWEGSCLGWRTMASLHVVNWMVYCRLSSRVDSFSSGHSIWTITWLRHRRCRREDAKRRNGLAVEI